MPNNRRNTPKISPKKGKEAAARKKGITPKKGKPPVSRRRKDAPKSAKRSLLRRLTIWTLTLGIWAGVLGLLLLAYYAHDLPELDGIDTVSKRPSIVFLTQDETILASYGDLYGDYMQYEDLPPALVQALLATEDRRFFQHIGVDPLGLLRAFVRNIQAGRVVEGGSTITQQLAKNLFLSPERRLKRKVQEVLLALWLEYRFTKEEILTLYFNRVYLGAGTYGVDAASRRYFKKSARDLNLSEAALIVGLLKAPSRYSPTNNPELARNRAHQVLKNMQDAGYITGETVELARQFPTQTVIFEGGSRGSYYAADWLLEQLPNYLGRIDQDIEVVTTLDGRLQALAEKTIQQALEGEGATRKVGQAALLAMTPDGAVRAMVGGRDYRESQFNRTTQALRQPGSAFKLFPYLAALERGSHPNDLWMDEPVTIDGWSPDNYSEEYLGPITLEQALARSINTVAAQVNEYAGRDATINMARRLGVSSPLQPLPSMALGTNEMTLMELTGAYAHLASGGRDVEPYGILEIRTIPAADNTVEGMRGTPNRLYRRLNSVRSTQLATETTRHMHRMLSTVMSEGTGRSAALSQHPAAGKTGTSQNYRDAWFIGYTANLVTGIWMGNDDNSPTQGVTGGSLPARSWRQFMQAALAGTTPQGLESTLDGRQDDRLPWQQPSRPSFWDFFFLEEQSPAPVEDHGQKLYLPRGEAGGNPQHPSEAQPIDANDPAMPAPYPPPPRDRLGEFIDTLDDEVEYEYPKPARN